MHPAFHDVLRTVRSAAALLLAACGAAADRFPPLGVRDSAGVIIVEAPPPESLPRWTIRIDSALLLLADTTATASIGDGFHRALRLSGGRFLVTLDQEMRIAVLDSLARPVTRFGRRGEGPGEYLRVPQLTMIGDTLVAVTSSTRRGNVRLYDASWRLIRELHFDIRLPTSLTSAPELLGSNGAGKLLFVSQRIARDLVGPYRADEVVFTLDLTDATTAPLFRFAGEERIGLGPEGDTYPMYGKYAASAFARGRLFTGSNDGFVIDLRNVSGQVIRSTRLHATARPVTRAMRHDDMEQALRGVPPEEQAFLRANYTPPHYADAIRFYEGFTPGSDGGLWVWLTRVVDSLGRDFLLIDPDGHPRAVTHLPYGMQPWAIWGDTVLVRTIAPEAQIIAGLYRIERN